MQTYKNTKIVRMIVLMVLDVIAVVLSSLFSLAIRFDMFSIPQIYLEASIKCYIPYAIISIGILSGFHLYNRVWSYASAGEIIGIIKASVCIEFIFLSFHTFFHIQMPRSYYPLNLIFLIMLFTIIRFSKVFYMAIKNSMQNNSDKKRIMVVGAGAAASLLIKELKASKTSGRIICAIDDNINKKNKYILGVQIVGDRNYIYEAVREYNIEEIIIAMPSATSNTIKDIIKTCQETGKIVKILPNVAKSLTSSVSKEIRNVNYEDLLGREPIVVNHKDIKSFIMDKTVLVTGGGGSIGSELCRQIVKNSPKKLIIFDIYENNAYEIQMELERHFPAIDIITLIGSIRDYDRMESVFKKYRPDVVYHAAAHKHVPLMEKSPNEAIKNNCLGTLNVVKLADKYEVSNFILISTDKAVRPTNIMGATKRICEMIVQSYSKKSKNTRFVAVRFGNVLGSNGSVIPLFLRQIEEGGPVTVTHKEITRFFMTIPEAVSLVLQAGLFAKGGEIFVLDMGNPVKIYELAENIIRMKNLVPNKDIEIEIVGLRPGEKLYEEILMDEEGLDKTENNMIFIGKPLKIDEEVFLSKLDVLIEHAKENRGDIKELTEDICDTYTITNN